MIEIQKALVTGANGFMGTNLCEALRAKNIPVVGMILPDTQSDHLERLGVKIFHADITKEVPKRFFEGVTHVFHLAAIPFDWGPWDLYYNVHVKGLNNVLVAAVKSDVAHFIHMSTLAVHKYNGHLGADEKTPRGSKINAYAATKNIAEDLVLSYQKNLQVSIIRPGIVPYGPWDRLGTPELVKSFSSHSYAHIKGGKKKVTLSYIENLVDGIILVGSKSQRSGEVYNITDDVVTWREYTQTMARVFEKPIPKLNLPYWPLYFLAFLLEVIYSLLPIKKAPPLTRYRIQLFFDDLDFRSDKAKNELGYEPKISLEQGMQKTKNWYELEYKKKS
jgi:nucleoside-diphosphate-sugar epimerase